METYKIDPVVFRKYLKKNTTIYIVIIGTIGLAFAAIFMNDYLSSPSLTPLVGLCIFLGFFIPFGIFSILRIRKKLQSSAEIFRLKIESNQLTKQCLGKPNQTILFSDIKTIYQYKNGLICIQPENALKAITIPSSIEHRVQLEEKLKQIIPFAAKAPSASALPFRILLPLTSLICLGCYFFIQKDGWLYAGLALFALYYLLKLKKK
jgi:hypothetical protein